MKSYQKSDPVHDEKFDYSKPKQVWTTPKLRRLALREAETGLNFGSEAVVLLS